MTLEELDNQIDIDRKLFLTEESSLFLDEGLDAKKFKKSMNKGMKNVKKGITIAGDVGGKASKKAIKNVHLFKKQINKQCNKLKNIDANELTNDDTSSLGQMFKMATKYGALTIVCGGPILGTIAYLTTNAIKQNTDNNKRLKLFTELRSDKAVVDAKIEDLKEKKQHSGLDKQEQEQYYALVKCSNDLDGNMRKLKASIEHHDSKAKNNKINKVVSHFTT
jgi:hypothetical protein